MTKNAALKPELSALGKKSSYETTYNPSLLFPISRKHNRNALEINTDLPLPFYGYDYWNHYEVSWLNEKGKPIVALAEIIYPCHSPNIIESKSMKLYFNSLNNTHFKDSASVQSVIKKDLAEHLDCSQVTVRVTPLNRFKQTELLQRLKGFCLDELDITCSVYQNNIHFLKTEDEDVEEVLCSDLLKSNCLVTSQPDWCSVQIAYKGKKINHEGLLKYLISFRNDNEFHEQCIEKIFMHIMQKCHPDELTVCGRSTRRGGLDINSIRSKQPVDEQTLMNMRLCRQ